MGIDADMSPEGEDIPHDHLYRVTGLSSSNLEKLAQAQQRTSDFEEAMSATGYGRFHVLLMLCSVPAFWSAVSVTSAVSYIFTKAQCDLQLSMLDMGTVNAITYAGMISSAMLWGFLSDTLGRKRIMVWGFLCSGLVEMVAALSQNFIMLLITRFGSGFFFNGPFAILISYIAELHRTELRARVILLSSLFYTVANTTLPLLAWSVLASEYRIQLWGDQVVIHSWNIFLMATALMPLVSGFAFMSMPESPKFLMSRGRNEEAMEVFRKIYSMNSGRPKEEYPIEKLVKEKSEQQGQGMAALRGGWAQLSPLFRMPHGPWLLLMCVIHLGCMFGSNTLRLWYPQLAAMLTSSAGSLCAGIAPAPVSDNCAPLTTDVTTYLQSAAVGSGSVLSYVVGAAILNACGKRLVSGCCGLFSAAVVIMMPFLGSSAAAVAVMMTATLAFTSLGAASLSTITVDLFPTSLRVMAMATFLMSGRIGTIAGTVVFPALISYGCYPPFIAISAVLAICGCACFFLPNTTLKKLE